MSLSYESALSELEKAVKKTTASRSQLKCDESILLTGCIGRVAASDIKSPISTPEYDTSAMDGFAISSDATKLASPKNPVLFRVHATLAAGDDPSVPLQDKIQDVDEAAIEPCVEIMTGARFPTSPVGRILDACVKVEDVLPEPENKCSSGHFPDTRIISVTKPVPRNAHHRFAGEDIQRTSLILRAGQTISPYHLMPLASVGIKSIDVVSKPRICIWSTGNELKSRIAHTRDVNGVFLTNAGRDLGAETRFLGTIEDDTDSMAREIQHALTFSSPEILITSGGVSVGQFDCVRRALDLHNADIIFHGLAIRPGHPVLFALLPSPRGKVAFFGLPGNPGAAAACFKFLVEPYTRRLLGKDLEQPKFARFQSHGSGDAVAITPMHLSCRSQDLDIFRPGVLRSHSNGENIVSVVSNQMGPAKLSPFIHANCWIHFSRRSNGGADIVACYSMSGNSEV